MSIVRIPVLTWRDHSGLYSASVVEQPETAAVGSSVQECLRQIKHHLNWLQRAEPWNLPDDEIKNPQLVRVPVNVRPEYAVANRRHPVSHDIRVTAPCVYGETEYGLLVCSIPPLRIWFSYHDAKRLKELAAHYVRESLQGQTPQKLTGHLNASEFGLEEVLIPVSVKDRRSQSREHYEALEQVAEALGDRTLRKQFSRAWERESEISGLINRVRRDGANVLLVGEPGVGKTSVLVSAAREVERQLQNVKEKRLFWMTGGSRLIAGTPYLGQWEERLEDVIAELADFRGVLCIDNLLELVRLGGHDASDSVGAFLVPYMKHRELQVVAEATPTELDACRRILPELADAFQILPIDKFDASRAVRVLDRIVQDGARNLRVDASNEVVQTVFRLFHRFRPYEAFPGKAAVFTSTLLRKAAGTPKKQLTMNTVRDRFISDTGLPEQFLRDEVALSEDEVVDYLSSRVIGQPVACRATASVVTTFKAGLNDPGRPLGVMLFSGPTGVGKTELARSLSKFLFGHGKADDRLVRLDMSEYNGHGASERLVSDVNGNPSDFIKRMRNQPFSVVLLDEIEKASPDVFDMLLGVFDEGRLTDRFGRITTFQSAVLILTSNLGSGKETNLGFGGETTTDYDAEVMRFFRPEFYNRLDAVVAFNPLEETTIRQIAAKELGELAQREGFAKAELALSWDDAVVNLVADAGFDRRYGARPLIRAVEEYVVTPLARYLAAHPETRKRTLHLTVGNDDKVEFTINPSA